MRTTKDARNTNIALRMFLPSFDCAIVNAMGITNRAVVSRNKKGIIKRNGVATICMRFGR
jgi:hypothetical protein